MKIRSLILLSAFLISAWSMAQTPAPFRGTWKVTWQNDKRQQEAKLVIEEIGGTWKTSAYSQVDPCIGKEVPIALEKSTDNEVSIKLKFADLVPGCNDVRIKLKMLDDKRMTGFRGKFELTAVRD